MPPGSLVWRVLLLAFFSGCSALANWPSAQQHQGSGGDNGDARASGSVVLPALPLPHGPASVSYDGRSMIINGTRTLLLSGSVHYARVHPDAWGDALDLLVELGLNTVQTYGFWSLHEPLERGNWSWAGQGNVSEFVRLAAARGLHVVFRIGPYICGEYSSGGIPLWMRDSGAACYRCDDAVWEAEMARAVGIFVDELRPLLYPAGPIVDLQVENEYTGGEPDYIAWAVAMARNATTAVPWSICHDLELCSALNNASGIPGGAALCTINGFWMDQYAPFVTQPSPAWIAYQRAHNPLQPIIWTEDQAWFIGFESARGVRWSAEIAYGIARFVAYGGSWTNLYMAFGGSNFGITTAGAHLQGNTVVATAYAPDAVIDSFMLRHEPRWSFFQTLFKTLALYAPALLGSAIPDAQPIEGAPDCEAHVYGAAVAFLSNMNATEPRTVSWRNASFLLSNYSVVMLDLAAQAEPTVVFNTSALTPSEEFPPTPAEAAAATSSSSGGGGSLAWDFWQEPLGSWTRTVSAAAGAPPPEQLRLTNGSTTDYALYVAALPSSFGGGGGGGGSPAVSVVTGGAEAIYVFLNGTSVNATSSTAYFVGRADGAAAGVAPPGTIAVLVAAMGMPNVGEGVSPLAGKGVQNVTIEGVDTRALQWNVSWLLEGEAKRIFEAPGTGGVPWASAAPHSPPPSSRLTWFRAYVDLPALAADAPAPNQTAYALNFTGLNKGVAWMNGFHLGRYSLQPGTCFGAQSGDCFISHGPHCNMYWFGCGSPAQTLYHVPTPVLHATGNLLVLLEEAGNVADAPRNLASVSLMALHSHPQGGS